MASAIGIHAVAAEWLAAAQAMTAAFRTHHLVRRGDGSLYVSAITALNANGQWVPSPQVMQAAQTVAVYTGLLTPAEAKSVVDLVFPAPDGSPPPGVQRWNNPTYLRRALKALSYTNNTARAIAHLKERFSQYLPGSAVNPTIPQLQGRFGGPLPEYWISRVDSGLAPGQPNSAQVAPPPLPTSCD